MRDKMEGDGKVFNPKEVDERKYLGKILEKLHIALDDIEDKINNYSKEILENKRYIYDSLAEFDSVERAASRMDVHQNILFGEDAIKEREKIKKIIESPYLGRIDFESEEQNEQPVYIGIHGFFDPLNSQNIVFDWRAPISSMFYDFELGKAS